MHRNIKILLIASILIHAGTNLLAPVYAIFIERIGGSLLDAGVSIGIYALLRGGLYFIIKAIPEDKVSRKVMVVTGYWVMGIGYSCYMFASAAVHVFGIQAILAIGESIVNPSWSAIIADSLEKGKERAIYANFYGYRSIFEGLAAIAGGLFAHQFGFDLLFGIMCSFAMLSGLIALFLYPTNELTN